MNPRSFVWAACSLVLAACGGNGQTASTGHGGAGGASTGMGSTSGAGGHGGSSKPPVCDSPGMAPPGFHVSPTGSPNGDGSMANPWDLATALLQPAAVKPGDTIWLHSGTYTGGFVSKLNGQTGAPITARSYPGEWAVIDGKGTTEPTLQIYKQYAIFQDIEVINSDPTRLTTDRPSGIYVEAKYIKLINLLIHDTGTGVICNSGTDANPDELALELEVYGCLLYNNGWQDVDRGHGHHLYLQNKTGKKHVLDNIIFNAFGFGIHAYSDNDGHYAQGYEITGNVWFQNGAGGPGVSKLYDNCMVGHNGTHPVADVTLRENYGWAQGTGERDVRLGWSAPNTDAHLFDNYIVGQTIFQPSWTMIEMSNNTFYGDMTGVDPKQYPGNTYLAARPAGAKVVVRPNKHQAGRAHIIVYNWDLADTVDVDPSAALPMGAPFEIRNAQDYMGAPVLKGTYTGGTLKLPMTGLSVAQPIGVPDGIDPAERTGKEFNVFVLIGCAP